MSVSLVLGVNGQDGSYLAEALLRRGHTVVGVGRDNASRYVDAPDFAFRQVDLGQADELRALLAEVRPDLVFHFAAVHGAISEGFTYEAFLPKVMQVNVLALHTVLEHARLQAPLMRVFYAGSAKVFPSPWSGVLDEATPTKGTCLYSIGKIAAADIMRFYRAVHGVRSCNLIFFNHDSARRPSHFFLPKVSAVIARAKQDPSYRGIVKTLDFWIDLSAADELMERVVDIAEAPDCPEVIMASGTTLNGRNAMRAAFSRHGLDLGAHLEEQSKAADPGPFFQADITKLVSITGCKPTKTYLDVIDDILEHAT